MNRGLPTTLPVASSTITTSTSPNSIPDRASVSILADAPTVARVRPNSAIAEARAIVKPKALVAGGVARGTLWLVRDELVPRLRKGIQRWIAGGGIEEMEREGD